MSGLTMDDLRLRQVVVRDDGALGTILGLDFKTNEVVADWKRGEEPVVRAKVSIGRLKPRPEPPKLNPFDVLRMAADSINGGAHWPEGREALEAASAAVAELIADAAAARRERDEMREEKEQAELELAYLANELVYEGNSIGWIASKAKNYKAALGRAFDALHETVGVKADGRTELCDLIRQRGAAVAELIEVAEVVAATLEGPRDRLGRLRTILQNPLAALRAKFGCGPAQDYLDGSAQVLRAALSRIGGAA